MPKLQLQPKPTFAAKVEIPAAGLGVVPVEFIFKHRTRLELKAFLDGLPELGDDVAMLQAIASGWELADPFDAQHLQLLVDNYVAAPKAVLDKYVDELARGRAKN